jgi:H+/Cl- antiporter ClcA
MIRGFTFVAVLATVILTAVLAVFLFNKFFAKESLELVDDWKNWKKEWSTWLAGIGAAIVGVFIAAPSTLLDLWNMLPFDIKSSIPPQYLQLIGLALVIISIPAKIIKQKKLDRVTPPAVTVVEPAKETGNG